MFNDIFEEILDGTILSDGCLHIKKNGINAGFSMSLKPDSEEWINILKNQFAIEGIKCWIGKYTRKTGISSINLATQVNDYLTELHKRWYKNGKKIIPNDLELTPKSLAYWFMGDGSSRWYKRGIKKVEVSFCTECFTLDEVKSLQDRLYDIGITDTWLNNYRNKGWRIILKKSKSVHYFMEMIEPYILECFRYKIKHPLIREYNHIDPIWKKDNTRQKCKKPDCNKTALLNRTICYNHKSLDPITPKKPHFYKSKIKLKIIVCECGCEQLLVNHDLKGEERKFIYQHYSNLLKKSTLINNYQKIKKTYPLRINLNRSQSNQSQHST